MSAKKAASIFIVDDLEENIDILLAVLADDYECGAVDYITKPILAPIVQARVSIHPELKEARERLADHNIVLEQKVNKRTANCFSRSPSRVK